MITTASITRSPKPLRRLIFKIILLLALTYISAGCSQIEHGKLAVSPTPQTGGTAPSQEGNAVLKGKLSAALRVWPGEELTIYAAPFIGQDAAHGFFLLDPDRHAHAALGGDGSFTINNLPAGQYVLVVGPRPQETRPVVDDQHQPRLIRVQSGKSMEMGELPLAP
jgi:hypothetical protein